MNNNYLEIENQLLLYKSKAQILQMYIELLKRTDKAIEYIETNVKEHEHDDYDITLYYSLNQNECDELLEILRGNSNEQ